MRTILTLACLTAAGCIVSGDDPCDAPPESVYDTVVFDTAGGQAYLTTPAAAKDCHAVFTARLAYTGDDAFDPALPRPAVDVSANAVGTGGEQPGLLGILAGWQVVEDADTGAIGWWAEMDAGAKNIDAPAVTYGMAAALMPAEVRIVEYYAQIDYRPPPVDGAARAACGAAR